MSLSDIPSEQMTLTQWLALHPRSLVMQADPASQEEYGQDFDYETGKILSEGLGEAQEIIDICDFAVGLSRQLYGLTIATERPGHRMMETWHPLGVCGVITAFNFPAAVWGWNAAIALVCGDPVVWKASEKAPLTALACDALLRRIGALRRAVGHGRGAVAGFVRINAARDAVPHRHEHPEAKR